MGIYDQMYLEPYINIYVTAAGSLSPETSTIPVDGYRYTTIPVNRSSGVRKGKLLQVLNVNRILLSLMG